MTPDLFPQEDAVDDACRYWNHAGCAGTAHCPPRCPWFVDEFGDAAIVRPAELADGPAIADLDWTGDGHEQRTPTDVSEGHHLVATDGDAVVGHAALVPADGDLVLSTAVAPERRGGGLREELCR